MMTRALSKEMKQEVREKRVKTEGTRRDENGKMEYIYG